MDSQSIVYVVDDDKAVLDSTTALLESVGLKVKPFASAEEFLLGYWPDQSGCLLLDVRLPGMSGIALAKKLEADGSDLTVILISGHATSEVSEEAMSGNVIGRFEKPMDSHQLIELIRNVINRGRSNQTDC